MTKDTHPKLSKLTLDEKISLLSGANFWNTVAIENQSIPSIMLTDGPHGLRKQGGKSDHLGLNKSLPATCFPTAATLANSWDEQLVEKVGQALGQEAYQQDVTVLLGPGLNIKRNPLCGRNFEYFSEDPYISGQLAGAIIRGIQSEGVVACPKHFAVNSQELFRMTIDEVVDERALHEMYLEGFRLAIKNGNPHSIMTSYNRINGTFANEHPTLITDVLKDQWGFDGLIVTDWGGNNDTVAAIKAGTHLEMPSSHGLGAQDIKVALDTQRLSHDELDQRVSEFLYFVDEFANDHQNEVRINYQHHHQIAKQAAEQSMVLLKNNNQLLPLQKGLKIALIGEFATRPRYQGAGSSLIEPIMLTDLHSSLIDQYEGDVVYAPGYRRLGKKDDKLLQEAINIANESDVVICFIGLDESREAEGVDRSNLLIQENQMVLIKQLAKLNKPIVGILAGGAPIEMPFIDDLDACLHGYLPGQAGGEALVSILLGDVNPSGKLAETYPMTYLDVPSAKYYPGQQNASLHKESIFFGYRYHNLKPDTIRFEMGYGLSYTSFEYLNATLSDDKVLVTLKNTGAVEGSEIVQIYIKKLESNILRPHHELKGFCKVNLKANETKTVEISLSDHAYHSYDIKQKKWVVEAGDYLVQIGASSLDIKFEIGVYREGKELDKVNGLEVYESHRIHEIDDNDFEKLLGYKLPENRWNMNEPMGMNSMIIQGRDRSKFGRLVNWGIEKVYEYYMFREKPITANNVRFVQNLPFRGAARMSNGALNYGRMWGLIHMMDGQFLKGLSEIITGKERKSK